MNAPLTLAHCKTRNVNIQAKVLLPEKYDTRIVTEHGAGLSGSFRERKKQLLLPMGGERRFKKSLIGKNSTAPVVISLDAC